VGSTPTGASLEAMIRPGEAVAVGTGYLRIGLGYLQKNLGMTEKCGLQRGERQWEATYRFTEALLDEYLKRRK
jgi:hypothetical protein